MKLLQIICQFNTRGTISAAKDHTRRQATASSTRIITRGQFAIGDYPIQRQVGYDSRGRIS
jgi:hypothetical protein